jgi:hypothetical protein
MSSEKPLDLLDLERDIPTTPEDIRALRENRPKPDLHWLDQLQILVDQVPNAHELRLKRRTFAGCEPFEL